MSTRKAISCTSWKAGHSFPCLDLHPASTSCQSHFVLECLESLGGRAVEGVLGKVWVLLMWQKSELEHLSTTQHTHRWHLQLNLALTKGWCFVAIDWRKRRAAKCHQVHVNLYKCLICSLLYARGSKRKMRSELWLVCVWEGKRL